MQVGAQPSDTARNIISSEGVLLKNHLLNGVKKGALTQEEADKKFAEWLKDSLKRAESKLSKLEKDAADKRKKDLELEKEASEKRKLAAEQAAHEAEQAAIEAEKSAEEWGALVKENNNANTTYPKIITVHGTDDMVVDVKNSYELIDQWSNLHQTDTIPDKTIHSFGNNPIVKRSAYFNKNQKEVIIAYWIEGTGHKLLVDPGNGEKQGGTTGLFAVDKNFFSTYYIAKDFGLLE